MSTTPYADPKITIKDIQTRTGVPITGEFVVETLKVAPVETIKRAVFWGENQYGTILDVLCAHLQACKGKQDKAPKAAPKPPKDAPTSIKGTETSGGFFTTGGTAAPAPAPVADSGFNFAAAVPAPAAGGFEFGAAAAPAADTAFKF